MSELQDRLDMRRGEVARELLDNEVLQEALKAIEAEIVQQWEACPARDAEGKEALWQLMKTSKKFRNILTGYIETGKLASDNLRSFSDRKSLRERFKLA